MSEKINFPPLTDGGALDEKSAIIRKRSRDVALTNEN